MECRTKDELEQHLSDTRRLATSPDLTSEERDAAVRAERFGIIDRPILAPGQRT